MYYHVGVIAEIITLCVVSFLRELYLRICLFSDVCDIYMFPL